MTAERSVRAVVVGLGSIGRRHLANLRTLYPSSEVIVWRHAVSQEAPPEGVRWVYDIESVRDFGADVALVANPAPFHVPIATALAAENVHLLIEKPISASLDGVSELIEECARRKLVVMTGYTLRFSPALRSAREAVAAGAIGEVRLIRADVGASLAEWRRGVDHMKSVSAQRSLGGGAVLELSHEFDYVRWIGGEVASVTARFATLGKRPLDVEDTAEVILEMQNGAMASVHLDMWQSPAYRQCRVAGTKGTLIWDGVEDSVRCYSNATGEWSMIHPPSAYDRNEMYLAELKEFFDCITHEREPSVTALDGLKALEIAVAAKHSNREGRTVAVNSKLCT